MSPLYLLGGAEVLVLGTALVRLRAALRDPHRGPKPSTGPILLFEVRSEGSERRKTPPACP